MPHIDKNDPERLDRLAAEVHEFPGIRLDDETGDLKDNNSAQDLITHMLQEAVQHYTDNLEPEQVKATDYYYGRPFGNEEDGRSHVVSTDVKDVTAQQMPDLLRMFMGAENVVEFMPQDESDVLTAAQKTDMVNVVIRHDNQGYLIFQDAFKDALVRKVGYFKWWWEDIDRLRAYQYREISEQGLQILMDDEDVNDVEILAEGVETIQVPGPEGPEDVEIPIFDVLVKRFESDGRAKFSAVPPEEIVWTPDAKDFESAGLVAHTRETTVDEAAKVTGLEPEDLEQFVGKHERMGTENLGFARQFHGGGQGSSSSAFGGNDETRPFSQRSVLLTEAYAMMDLDGDGVAELRMFHCLGPNYEIVNGDEEDANGNPLGEIANEIPMAYITPEPEPHTVVGLCNYDNHRDIQEVKSEVRRGMLNSLAMAIEPQMEVVASEVNMKDLLNPEVSNIIRTRRPGMIREIRHTFLGAETIAVEEHFNEVRGDRGGMTRASEGLDPDALQSSTPEAVGATLDKAQQRIEGIARTFAETGVKRLYLGILRLLIENQDRPRMIKLRGTFTPVDPQTWDINTEVTVNSALGSGSIAQKTAVLSSIIQDQDARMQAGSPFVNNTHVRNALGRLLKLAGFEGSDEFYAPWGDEQEAKLQEQIAQQPPPPDPAMELVKIEGVKVQTRAIADDKKNQLEQQKAAWEDDFKRDKLARDSALKEAEIEAEFQKNIDDAALQRRIQADRIAQSANEGPAGDA